MGFLGVNGLNYATFYVLSHELFDNVPATRNVISQLSYICDITFAMFLWYF